MTPDKYETMLMVDADTKIFPDSLSRLISCMVKDPEIAGLCGETKIGNKTDSWVSMMQGMNNDIYRKCIQKFSINLF
jgi:chitin synthase